jgi:hypothetical protein
MVSMSTEMSDEASPGLPAEGSAPPADGQGPARPAWEPVFLQTLAETANVQAACRAAGVARSAVYKARRRCPEFHRQWKLALADACDQLEAKAREWALGGDRPMLIFLLKAHRPRKYRDAARREPRAPEPGVAETTLQLYAEGVLTPRFALSDQRPAIGPDSESDRAER